MTTTQAQERKLDDLMSYIDEAEVTREKNGTIVFEGYSSDGPSVGIIQPDGTIEWVCGAIEALKDTSVVTADCGHKIAVGQRAYSHYTCAPGVIEPFKLFGDSSGPWFDFRQDDGRAHLLDGQRVCCLKCARRYGYPNAE